MIFPSSRTHFNNLFWIGFLFFNLLGLFCLWFPAEFMTDSAHYFWGAQVDL